MNAADKTAAREARAPLLWGGALLLLCALLAGLLLAAPVLETGTRLLLAAMAIGVGVLLLAGLFRSLGEIRKTGASSANGQNEAKDSQIAQLFRMLPGCAWRANGELQYVEFFSSPETLFNATGWELAGAPLWRWVPDETRRQRLRDALQQAIDEQRPHLDLAWKLERDDSQARWIGETLYLKYDDSGRLQFIVGLSNDITERKRKEAELTAMQQHARKMEAVGTLVGGIAHEFNNMLAGMVGNLFLLKGDLEGNPKQLERLERIEALTRRASRLIEQMLTFGRKQPARLHRISLDSLVREFVQMEEPRLPAHIRFDVSIARQVSVRADSVQLRQMLGSLLQNAIDAVADVSDAIIVIRLDVIENASPVCERHPHMAPAARLARILIRDNGCGIPRKHLDRVFDPFFTTKEVGSGTGMGLSMAYGVMEASGGAIELESEEGRGTSVHLYFPIADPDQDEWVRDQSGEVFLGQGETLLLADDEEMVREAACNVLRRLGYRVLTAANGAEAISLVRQEGDEIDLVILDLIMPDIGGMEAARRIRAIRPDMPLIFITGYDLDDTLDRQLHMDGAHVVSKPFDVCAFSRAVRRLLTSD